MDNSAALSLLDDLTTNIDELTTALEPLLNPPIEATASTLSLFEKAKLYTLSTYALEAVLFSYIRLNASSSSAEADARTHPVFTELRRVQQYMQKIEMTENPDYGKRENMSLDKGAAARFIKAGLSGNDRYDAERKKREEEQRVAAKRKLDDMDAKASVGGSEDGEGSAKKKSRKGKKGKKGADVRDGEGDGPDNDHTVALEDVTDASPKKKKKKRAKKAGDET